LEKQKQSYRSVSSGFGPALLLWHRVSGATRVIRVILPDEGEGPGAILTDAFPEAGEGSCPAIDRLARDMERFLNGRPVEFSLDLLDFEVCSSFQRRVLVTEFRVPRGVVTTYGRLARRIRAPGAARAVGSALARNPFPLIIPCHRCIRENGQLGGFRGGLDMKKALLEMEGIALDGRGRVPREHVR
jgi:methylated-DNA-[protein]-cysteine S-methyltransferase